MNHYHIGQRVRPSGERGIVYGPVLQDAEWYGLKVKGGGEARACRLLKAGGVHAFFPVEERLHRRRGRLIVSRCALVTQIVYAKMLRAPQWDVLRDRRIITGVYSRDGAPLVIPPVVMRAIGGLPADALAVERAKEEAGRVRAGDMVTLLDGPLAGLCVDVVRTSDGQAWWQTAGAKGQAPVAMMRKKPLACLHDS